MRADGVSGDMVVAIYVMLFIMVTALTTIGLLATFRWVDEKIEAAARWFQMANVRDLTNEQLQDLVQQLNEEQNT